MECIFTAVWRCEEEKGRSTKICSLAPQAASHTALQRKGGGTHTLSDALLCFEVSKPFFFFLQISECNALDELFTHGLKNLTVDPLSLNQG